MNSPIPADRSDSCSTVAGCPPSLAGFSVSSVNVHVPDAAETNNVKHVLKAGRRSEPKNMFMNRPCDSRVPNELKNERYVLFHDKPLTSPCGNTKPLFASTRAAVRNDVSRLVRLVFGQM